MSRFPSAHHRKKTPFKRADFQLPDYENRFANDFFRHLGTACVPINKYNGNFADAEPFFGTEIIHLDLKGIAVGFHPAKINGLKDLSAKAFEATRAVGNPETGD